MTLAPPVESCIWEGPISIEKITALVRAGCMVEIPLPLEVENLLYAHLLPESDAEPSLIIDVHGDELLLWRIAQIEGMGSIAELTDVVINYDLSVEVKSPPPRVILSA